MSLVLPRVLKAVRAAHSVFAALLLCAIAPVASAQTSTVITNPAIGVFTGGNNLTAKIVSASISGVVISATKSTGTFPSSGVLRLCRGAGNTCETVLDAPYASGASTVTFPSFTPRSIRQDFYYVQRVDVIATTTGGLDPGTRSGSMIVIVDSPQAGRENAAQVSVASGYACALTTAGSVKCWSGGAAPQALNGAPTYVTKVALSSSSSTDFSCLLASGAVYCWGNSVGDGTSLPRATPVAITGIPGTVTDIFVGYSRACALSGTSVWCWRDYGYEVASGYQPNPPYPATLAPVAFSALGNTVTDITMNIAGACALSSSGDVACWGTNLTGNLGNPNNSNTRALSPVGVVSGLKAKSLAATASLPGGHVCAVTYAGDLWCWGSNSSLQLGRAASATPTSQPAPANLLLQNVVSAAVGGDATCATHPGGKASCWGNNARGRLGIGGVAEYEPTGNRTGVVLAPSPVLLGDAVVSQLVISDVTLCAVLSDGAVRCAGPATNLNTTSIPSSTAFTVDGFGPTQAVLPAPTVTQATRARDIVSLKYQDNQSAVGAPITAHQWACYPQLNGNLGNAAEVVTNEAPGTLHVVQGTLSTRVGPWQCKVRLRTSDGISAWSLFVTVTQNVTADPTVTSAIYDGAYGTVTWKDNSSDAAGPVISKITYCTVQWRNAPTVQVTGCEPQNSRCYLDSSVSEPTNQTHVSRLPLPPATDFSSGTCRVIVYTFDGNFASVDVPLTQAASPAPAIVAGRVIGTQAVLTFADNRADSAGTILSAVYACTRVRDGATSSNAIAINEPANAQHTITVPLIGNNLLQDPDTHSCKVRVTPSVGTVSPDSAAFTIGPNSPPVVTNFAFTASNGVITGAFDINDPEGDQVKNVIAYFGSTPRSTECSSGTLGASWDIPRGGGRLQFNASLTNVGCAALTASAATIYGFVTAQDVNGLYATIVDAQSSNTPPAPIPVSTTTTYSIVFDAVPTTLAVKQAVDISMRIVDQNGVTATQFRGPVRISLSVSGINFSYEDPNQPAADTTSNRVVWFTNGAGRLRAFRLNDEARVRLIAVARADGTSQLTASPSAMAQAQANVLAANQGERAKAASTVGYAGVISGTSSDVSSVRSNATPNVTITLPKGTLFQSSSFLAEWKTGAIRAYLRNTYTQAELPAGGAAAAADGLSVSFAAPMDNYVLIFKRGAGLLPGGEPMQVDVGATGFKGGASPGNFLLDSAKRRLILVHGIFGSTTDPDLAARCWLNVDKSSATSDYDDITPEMPKDLCERSPDERARGVWSNNKCAPAKLSFVCTGAETGGLGLWGDLETRFTALGYKVVRAPWDWRLAPSTAAMEYLQDVVTRESTASGQPVDILAHSMGGLVTLNLLKDSQFRRRIDRVVLLGTPLAGSVNAYGLMEVADPMGLENVTKVTNGFYSSVAAKLYETCFMAGKGSLTKKGGTVETYNQRQATRRQAFSVCAPAGLFLYPDKTYLPFTKGSDTGGVPVAHVPPPAVSRGLFDSADAPNNLTGLSTFAECVPDTVARSGTLTIPASAKARVTLILSNEMGGLDPDGKPIATRDTVQQSGKSVNYFYGASNAPLWSSIKTEFSAGDGTVPLRGQIERLAAFLGTTADNIGKNCAHVGKFQDHANLTRNAAAIEWAVVSLPLAVAKLAITGDDTRGGVKAAAAAVAPLLSVRVEGASAATLRNGSLPDVGVLPDGTRRDTATNVSGSVANSTVTASEIVVSVDNPALGGSVAMMYRSDTNNNTALVKTVTTYSDSAAVVLNKRKTLLVRAGVPAQMNVWLDTNTSLFSADVVAPAPVPTLTTRPLATSTRILWTAPTTTPVSVAGYRVYAARSQDDAWTLIGSVPAGTLMYDAPYPAASSTQAEWNFIVVSADSQDRYSEVLELGSNAVRSDIEANFGSARGTPGATVTSATVTLPNNVPVLVSVAGGQMSVNGGTWGVAPLVINPGDTVALRGVTPATRGAQQDVVLATGTSSTAFSVLGTPLPFCIRPTRPVAETGAFVRYLKNISGLPLLQGLYPTAEVTTTNSSAVETHYRDNITAYDFNGDNATNVLIDGLLYARYALGFRGAELVAGIAVGTTRTTAQIETALAACQ
jgi:pimeloyl-ACP methyl ester carboxylesterase